MLHLEQMAALGNRAKALGQGTAKQAIWDAMDVALFEMGDSIARDRPKTAKAGLRG